MEHLHIGILNLDEEVKIYNFRKRGAYFIIRDYSWWDLELPTNEVMKNGFKNLVKVNYKVDYIISHCCLTSVQAILGVGKYKKDCLTDYLQQILEKYELKNGILDITTIISKLICNIHCFMKI